MLTVIRHAGQLMAACDWWLVDSEGRFEPRGQWVFVNQLELNPQVESRVMIRQIITQISQLCPWAIGAYWERRDKARPDYRSYTRIQLVRGGMQDATV